MLKFNLVKSLFMGICVGLLLSGGLFASASSSNAPIEAKPLTTPTLRVEVFLSTTCSHCKKLNAYLKTIAPQTPWLDVHAHYINQDRSALDTYAAYLKTHNLDDDFAVPAIFYCNQRWLGFKDAETSGKKLMQSLIQCRDKNNQVK